jgi:prophage antirepressor-like protein
MRTEIWNGHEIRFVEKQPGDWWAVLSDVSKAMNLRSKRIRERLDDEVVSTDHVTDALGRVQEMLIVNEYGIYEAIFESRKREAKEFKRWVFGVIKQLRQSTGLEAFQVFRMLDKEHQREAMNELNRSLKAPGRPDFIKANVIADKAVSTKFGHAKMLKKAQMSPAMLVHRQPILEDTVQLMSMVDHFGLNLSVSKTIYSKHAN